jgi:hypothetical protein
MRLPEPVLGGCEEFSVEASNASID